ncbi:Transfer protein [Seminavis robusta]|uniref:Transfer protein n=1 Tax=Seminavis robusta TaxID=568900 RepID=A0A9N8EX57_9STRA|nr:Transfer protein [Seminavis robusta]|eukprot:Sro2306_g322710.1 Transfer protein (633) ;mRNA; f:2110-4008
MGKRPAEKDTSPRRREDANHEDVVEANKEVAHGADVDPVTRDVLSLTQKELDDLPPSEQHQVVVDLYGLDGDGNTAEDSSPAFVDQKLEELETALKQIPDKRKMAYNQALTMNAAYVTSRDFRLMFLRADRFQPWPAAQRLLTHLELKLELFGPDLLCQEEITQDDLDPTSLQVLYQTWFVDLPVRDRAGRQVVIMLSRNDIDCHAMPVLNRMRVLFYTLGVAARDLETQIQGRVYIIWVAGSLGKAADLWKISNLQAGAHIRHQGIHMCIDQESSGHISTPLVSVAQMAMNAFLRVRVRRHVGTPSELKFSLMTYGIPTEFIPISNEGEFAHQLHRDRWNRIRNNERLQRQHQQLLLKQHQQQQKSPSVRTATADDLAGKVDDEKETLTATTTKPPAHKNNSKENTMAPPVMTMKVVNTPSNSDILMGKGRGIQNHCGNIRFRKLIDQHRPQYDNANNNKAKKTEIAQEVVRIVTQDWQGRFLKEHHKLGWVPVEDDSAARRKVSSCFRDARKRELWQLPTATAAAHNSNNSNNHNQMDTEAAGQDNQSHDDLGAVTNECSEQSGTTGTAAAPADKVVEDEDDDLLESTLLDSLQNEHDDLSGILDSALLLDSTLEEFEDQFIHLLMPEVA